MRFEKLEPNDPYPPSINCTHRPPFFLSLPGIPLLVPPNWVAVIYNDRTWGDMPSINWRLKLTFLSFSSHPYHSLPLIAFLSPFPVAPSFSFVDSHCCRWVSCCHIYLQTRKREGSFRSYLEVKWWQTVAPLS